MNLKLSGLATIFFVIGNPMASMAEDVRSSHVVDYVRVCDAFGAGFFYIPGSDTCLKIGGYVRSEVRVGGSGFIQSLNTANGNTYISPVGNEKSWRNAEYTRMRSDITFDARSQTELGQLRSYIEGYITVNTPGGARPDRLQTLQGTPYLTLSNAFVQFGGLLAGRTTSAFSFWNGYEYRSALLIAANGRSVNEARYQLPIGAGVSATISVEDPTSVDEVDATGNVVYNNPSSPTAFNSTANQKLRRLGGDPNAVSGDATFGTGYAALKIPDVIANLNVTGTWGRAQIMAALHDDDSSYNAGTSAAPNLKGHDTIGYAIGAGAEVFVPMIAPGDKVAMLATYSVGTLGLSHQDAFMTALTASAATIAAGQKGVQLGYDFYDDGSKIHQTVAWTVAAGLHHEFSAQYEVNVDGSFLNVNGYQARDFTQLDLAADFRWRPVKRLSIGPGIEYRHINFSAATAAAVSTASSVGGPLRPTDAWVGLLRIEASF